jgi:dTDP-L-rhamnose 4-epimerase
VLAIFASRLLNGRPPRIFEDGLQRRDFVSVHDVARALATALEDGRGDGLALNVGSGRSVSVRELAAKLGAVVGRELDPEVTGESRFGDIRHCFADVAAAREAIGYEPQVALDEGVSALAAWLEGRTAVDRVDEAARELARRGLSA